MTLPHREQRVLSLGSSRAGDRERADAALVLLALLVSDMERFERTGAARPVPE